MKKTLLLSIAGLCSLLSMAQYNIYEQNGKFGIKDGAGDVVVSAEYDNMTAYKSYNYYGDGSSELFIGNKGGTKKTITVVDSLWGYTDDTYTYGVTGTKEREFTTIKGGSFFIFNGQGQQINADGYDNVALNFAVPVTYDYGEPYYYYFKTLDDDGNPKETDRSLIKAGSGIQVKKGGKWALMNMEPRFVIPFVSEDLIEEVLLYDQNYVYKVKKGKSTVLYNTEGKAITAEYDFIDAFNTWENYSDYTKSTAKVIKGGKIGYINLSGKEIIAPKYSYLIRVNSEIYIFNKGGKMNRYEWADSSAFYNNYDYYDPAENYTPQVYMVKDSCLKGGKFGVLKEGKEIIPASYSFIEYDAATLYFFGHNGGKEPENPRSYNYYGYSDYGYGDYDYGYDYGSSQEYTHYLAVERPIDSKRSVIDINGKVKLKDVESISLNYINIAVRKLDENGLYTNQPNYYHLITNKGKSGLINSDFKEVIPAKFAGFIYNYTLDNGSIVVYDENNKYGVYSVTSGKAITGMDYASIYAGDKFFYYNKGGKWAKSESSYYDYYTDSTYTYEVTNLVGGKYGVINAQGEDKGALYDTIYILGYKYNNNYDYGYYESSYNYGSSKPIVTFKKNDLMGIFASNGNEAVPAQFNSITYDYSSSKLNIMQNNLWGIANLNGKILIDPQYTSLYALGYNYYTGTSNPMYVATNQENLQGIIDTSGNTVFEFHYNWIDSYGYNQGNELVKVSNNSLYGYADRESKQVLPCQFEDINEYFNYTTKISIVTKDGKKGFYDRAERKMITEPKYSDVMIYDEKINGLTKVMLGGEVYYDSLSYMNRVRGGKIGYVDSLGNEIIAPLYDNVSYNNEIELYMGNKGKVRDFYDLKGQKVRDGETKWMSSYIGRKMMENSRIVELNWTSTNGPVGADATAFYYDEDGTYWLGTGSSGGVYTSKDQGKTWVETNKGIGPRHILFIGKLYDTLFIVDQGAGSYSNYELYTGEFGYFESVHYFNTNSKSWDLIPEERKYTIANELYNIASSNKYNTEMVQPISGYGTGTNYFPAYLNNSYYYNYPYNYVGSYNNSTYGYDTVAVEGMPKDCYNNAAGNVFKVEDNDYVLLSKSGIYKFYGVTGNDRNNIVQMDETGLKASDITQIGNLPSGGIIVREGTTDIWKYENNTWTKLLDAYKLNNELGESNYGYFTGQFSIDKKGNVLVPFRSNIYEISPDGNMKMIAEAGEISKFVDYSSNGFSKVEFIQAVRDKNNKTWILANAAGYYNNNFGVLELVDGKINYNDTLFKNSYGIPFLFADEKGNAWKYQDYKLAMVGNEKSTALTTSYYEFDMNKIACGPNGEIAVVKSWSSLSIYIPDKSKWVDITLEGAGTISAMEYDNKGNLMVSTNYEFEYSCGEMYKTKKGEPFIGYVEFSMDGVKLKSLNNPVNPRILSLHQHPTMGLMVGTSGSGLQAVTKK